MRFCNNFIFFTPLSFRASLKNHLQMTNKLKIYKATKIQIITRVSNFPVLKKTGGIRVMSNLIPGSQEKNRDCIKYKQQNVNASSLL